MKVSSKKSSGAKAKSTTAQNKSIGKKSPGAIKEKRANTGLKSQKPLSNSPKPIKDSTCFSSEINKPETGSIGGSLGDLFSAWGVDQLSQGNTAASIGTPSSSVRQSASSTTSTAASLGMPDPPAVSGPDFSGMPDAPTISEPDFSGMPDAPTIASPQQQLPSDAPSVSPFGLNGENAFNPELVGP